MNKQQFEARIVQIWVSEYWIQDAHRLLDDLLKMPFSAKRQEFQNDLLDLLSIKQTRELWS